MSDDTVTVPLSKPIADGERVINELTFREATAGDACRADGVSGEFAKVLTILAGMAGTTLHVMQQVPMRDLNAIIAATGHLMGEPDAAGGSK